MELKFIADHNVGKLAKWLRIMGYDTLFYGSGGDSEMLRTAIREERVVLTRDTHIPRRRVAVTKKVRVLFIEHDDFRKQLRQVVRTFNLDRSLKPFSICIECNERLVSRAKEEVKDRVPPYVFKTQTQYMECPSCQKIYWRGTHWDRMRKQLEAFTENG